MKLIVGLGNPGKEYERTRHNVGFMVVDALARKYQVPSAEFQGNSKFQCQMIQTKDVVLVKPQTFMNKSGEAVRKIADFYKITPDNIWVIHDDLDIKLGEYKINLGKGPKVHNGVESVELSLGTKEFWRIRIGTEGRVPGAEYRVPGETYVLKTFTEEEKPIISEVITRVANEIVSRNI
jgi:peptidyl-tRNA hydrolase, PTH1 family